VFFQHASDRDVAAQRATALTIVLAILFSAGEMTLLLKKQREW
jgi:hypothetical protein